MDNLEESLNTIRQRVDMLEVSSQEKRKPWYRQPSNIVAMVALLVSISSTFYSQSASKQETIRSKKEELRKLLVNLIDLRRSVLQASGSPDSWEVQSASEQQGLYLQAAQRLAAQIPNEVSSYEYGTLAEECQAAGESAQAEDYFQKGVSASSSIFNQAQSLRLLAVFYFTSGAKQDVSKGRASFERATQLIKARSDPYSVHIQALNYEAWATTEFQHGFAEQGTTELEEARKLYSQLPQDYPFRAHLITDLDQRVKNSGISKAFALGSALPQEVVAVLQHLSAADVRWIIETDLGDSGASLTTKGKDSKQNNEDERQIERLVTSGLVTRLSDREVTQEGRKANTHYDYGVRSTPLYAKTRDSFFEALMNVVASGQGPR
jgi:hypothetical protein